MLRLGPLGIWFLPLKLQHCFATVSSGSVCKCAQTMPNAEHQHSNSTQAWLQWPLSGLLEPLARLRQPRNYSLHPVNRIVQVLSNLGWERWDPQPPQHRGRQSISRVRRAIKEKAPHPLKLAVLQGGRQGSQRLCGVQSEVLASSLASEAWWAQSPWLAEYIHFFLFL